MKTSTLILAALFSTLAFGRSASAAGNGGVKYAIGANHVPVFQFVQDPGVTWTFQTSNLVGTAPDTVMHVQNYNDPEGTFIAGDDDGGGGLTSRIVVAPAATSRQLTVIVRAYASTTWGSCTFTATPSTGTPFSGTVSFGGGFNAVGDLPINSHIATAENHGGTDDTVILAFSGATYTHAIAFDDDDGVYRMSSMKLKEACTSCVVITGTYFDVGNLTTNLIWDGDVATNDADQDGLGVTLEGVLHTSSDATLGLPCSTNGVDCRVPLGRDTDRDGANDDAELFGLEVGPSDFIKYPLMGADPVLKDLFVELDWVKCVRPGTDCGPEGIDGARFGEPIATDTDAIVNQLEASYAPVRLHLDIGRANTTATWANWNDWGGAQRNENTVTPALTPENSDGCEGMTPARQQRFMHGTLFNTGGGMGYTNQIPGSCYHGYKGIQVFQHEMGHTMGLLHGGRVVNGALNYKSNYLSAMNYEFQNDIFTFSHGGAPTLNPTALDEAKGLGNGSPLPAKTTQMLQILARSWCPDNSCVNLTTGAVDWDRDNVFSQAGTLVRGAASMFNFQPLSQTTFAGTQLNDATAMYVTVSGTIGDRIYVFGRDAGTGQLESSNISKSAIAACDAHITPTGEDGQRNCGGMPTSATLAPSGSFTSFAPGAAELAPTTGNNAIVLVWQPTSGPLTSNIVTLDKTTGVPTWSAKVNLPGNVTATGDVTALNISPGVVKAWAVVIGVLNEWKYTNGTWTGPTVQTWDDTAHTPISAIFGIGATRGYRDGSTTAETFAAIVASNNDVDFAVQNAQGRWTNLSGSWATSGSPASSFPKPKSTGRPGLAYQRTAGKSAEVGRFYLMYGRPSNAIDPNGHAATIMTEGNDGRSGKTNKRLRWITPFANFSVNPRGGFSIVADLRDNHVRGVMTTAGISGMFLPLTDGFMNVDLKDQDDYAYLTGNIRAALSLDCPSNVSCWPNGGQMPASLP